MNFSTVYLNTLIPELPWILNNNNQITKRYLDVFYDETLGVIISPVNTPGRVKAATGEFVTTITDNLIVKKQWTNLYENTTTIDQDYYDTYIGSDVSTRDASLVGTLDNSLFKYVDVIKPYYKITNDVSTAFTAASLGQEFQLLFEVSTGKNAAYHVLLDPSVGGTYKMLSVTKADSSACWIKLIAVEYDASWGTTWAIKQYGGTYSII